jgi:hypothetical protein
MLRVKKTFIVRVINRDGSIVLIPFGNRADARAQEKKELKKPATSMVVFQEILL